MHASLIHLIPARPSRLVWLLLLLAVSASATVVRTNFINGAVTDHVPWLDTSGNLINAHDGGILYAEGKYHWYGLALRPFPAVSGVNGGQKTTVGVVMYGSTNFYDWDYEGVILACSTNPASPLCGPMRFERPKIIYNDTTKKYVLWCHYVGRPGDHVIKLGSGEAGVASCDTVNGQYTFHGYFRPLGTNGIVRDSTLFKDDDGSAYFIYDRDVRVPGPGFGRVLHIVKLSDDYLTWTSTFFKITNAAVREAPVMIKRGGFYFLINSGQTAWKFNRANYYRATNIFGPYAELGDPCVGANTDTTFNSQGTQAFAVEGKKDAVVLMCDRHNPDASMMDSSYIFLPVNFPSPSTLQLQYLETWNLDYWSAADADRSKPPSPAGLK
ncbi:MAG: family 43 glycosylhydrolase [Verrucomicrobiota bacterium]